MSTSQNLLSELRVLAADTEQLIEQVADQSEGHIVAARDKARRAVSRARAGFADLAQAGTARACAAGEAADEYVHENPWRMLAGVAIIGIIAGILMTRR